VTGIDYRRLYDYRLKSTGQPARQAVWTEIAIYLHQRMGSPERVLDVGAGRGEFITQCPPPSGGPSTSPVSATITMVPSRR
jgi:hypothetical protein